MPNMPDAPVILSGVVFGLQLTSDFETKAPTGGKVSVLAGDGLAIVKFSPEQLAAVKPIAGSAVVWTVRYVPYSVGDNSGVTTRFVAATDLGDLDRLQSLLTNAG